MDDKTERVEEPLTMDDETERVEEPSTTDDETEREGETPTDPSHCCPRRCVSRFDDEFKSRLASSMSRLTESEKRIHLFTMISLDDGTKRRPPESGKNPRSSRFRYTVKVYGVQRDVCANAFVRLHDTTAGAVKTLYRRMEAGDVVPMDVERRRRKPRVSEDTRKLIKDHLLGVLKSPAVSEFAMKGLGELNRTKLWLDFKRKYVTGSSNNLHLGKSAYWRYMNSFLTPKLLATFMTTQQGYKIRERCSQILKK